MFAPVPISAFALLVLGHSAAFVSLHCAWRIYSLLYLAFMPASPDSASLSAALLIVHALDDLRQCNLCP
ncbi:hypothetical protein OE88DRAFT_1649911 [Heliocybe sulcata]|uniref:Uncharacterized protein n=1 Tax=Heliocybe sulcata TaxID=5364 RepID=A0A5C3NIB4_9AGAM|nr:hypothetical protein OE88DRAFT_1649911 [Heliocybe sulcata]